MNPGSRGGQSEKTFPLIHRELRRNGIAYRCAVTSNLLEAQALSQKAGAAGYGTIVAVGGDGTINRVLNGLYHEDGGRVSGASLGVIYTGTSPDFCMSHGLPVRRIPQAVRVLAAGNRRSIPVGRIRFGDGSLRHFACCANVGIGPVLAEAANSGIRGRVGDKAGTFLALLRALGEYRPVDLEVNGERLEHVYNLSVGKTRYVASGLKINHKLNQGDNRFYVLPICGRVVRHVAGLYAGAALPLQYEERVEIRGAAQVECDGDPCGQLPVVIEPALPVEVLA